MSLLPPINVRAVPGGPREIVLSWSAPNSGSDPSPYTNAVPIYYNIYKGLAHDTEGTVPYVTNVTNTSYTDAGMINPVLYYYKVTAVYAGTVSNGYSSVESSKSAERSSLPGNWTSYNTGNNFRSVLPFLPKLIPSTLSSQQFSQFTDLITAYFQWLEQVGNVFDQMNSLLSIADSSVGGLDPNWYPQFAAENLPLYPLQLKVNNRTILNHMVNQYLSKGTPAAIEFLFKIIYNEDVTITYPTAPVAFDMVEETLIVTMSPYGSDPAFNPEFISYNILMVMDPTVLTGQNYGYIPGERVLQSNGFVAYVISWDPGSHQLLLNGAYQGKQVLVKSFDKLLPLVGETSKSSWFFGSKYNHPIMIDSGDGVLLNQFTYYINSPIDVDTYASLVKQNVHPAGLNFIGSTVGTQIIQNYLSLTTS